jgi:hypothetical protein
MFVFWKKKVRFPFHSYVTSVKGKHCYRNTFYFPFGERRKGIHAQFASLNTFSSPFENDIANGMHDETTCQTIILFIDGFYVPCFFIKTGPRTAAQASSANLLSLLPD